MHYRARCCALYCGVLKYYGPFFPSAQPDGKKRGALNQCLAFISCKEKNLLHFSHFSCMGGRDGRRADASHVDLEPCHPSLWQNPFPFPPLLVFISSSCLPSCLPSLPRCFFFLPLPTVSPLLFPSSLPPLPSFALFLVSSHFLPYFPSSAQTHQSPADTERSPNVRPLNAHTHTHTHNMHSHMHMAASKSNRTLDTSSSSLLTALHCDSYPLCESQRVFLKEVFFFF